MSLEVSFDMFIDHYCAQQIFSENECTSYFLSQTQREKERDGSQTFRSKIHESSMI
jgi:hypothetical protein